MAAWLAGQFVDGKLVKADAPAGLLPAGLLKASDTSSATQPQTGAPFGGVSGKTLTAVDGSTIALNLIEGGMELQVGQAEGTARKTTFTFMTDRMGTVVENNSANAGASVTGFFRLTDKGVEVRYADGRSAMLAPNGNGGVEMALDTGTATSCQSWYPAGHAFSEAEKKEALNAYASKLGLPITAGQGGCSSSAQMANLPIAQPAPAPAVATPASMAKAHPDHHGGAHLAKASYRIGDYAGAPADGVTVKASAVHLIDGPVQAAPVTVSPITALPVLSAAAPSDSQDASHCLSVDSDGGHWGFRNACSYRGAILLLPEGWQLIAQRLRRRCGGGQRGGVGLRRPDRRCQPGRKGCQPQIPLGRLWRRRRRSGGASRPFRSAGRPLRAHRHGIQLTSTSRGPSMTLRKSILLASCACFGAVAISGPALAAGDCASNADAAALKIAVLQQEMMVAAFTCHDADAYNRFVLANRSELQQSDADLKNFFIRRGGEHGEAGYDTFKTKAANLSALAEARNSRTFCADADAQFAATRLNSDTLAHFVALRTPPMDMAGVCREPSLDKTIAGNASNMRMAAADDVAISGVPAHDLPAAPYRRATAQDSAPAFDDPAAHANYYKVGDTENRYGPPQGWDPQNAAPASGYRPRWRWVPRDDQGDGQ